MEYSSIMNTLHKYHSSYFIMFRYVLKFVQISESSCDSLDVCFRTSYSLSFALINFKMSLVFQGLSLCNLLSNLTCFIDIHCRSNFILKNVNKNLKIIIWIRISSPITY